MKKISVKIAGRHATSFTIEKEFFEILQAIAKDKKTSINALITQIDKTREKPNLSSAIRVYVLKTLLKEQSN